MLTLGIGIGAASGVFGVVNNLILHPLPYRDGNRVMMVWRVDPKAGVMLSGDDELVDAWRDDARSVESIESYSTSEMTMTGRGDAASVDVAAIRSTFLRFTGIAPLLGRGFLPEETRPGGPHVVMLTEALWRSRYRASRDVLGQRITLNDKPYTIIGVTPAKLRLPALMDTRTDLWLGLGVDSLRYNHAAVARLRAGFSPEAAATELDSIIARRGIRAGTRSTRYETRLVPPGDLVRFRSSLFLLSGAVALLLAVACANVAHLLLARGATRERELAIRVALGAGRGRLVRQLLTESSVLAALGCVAGTFIGFASIRLLLALRPPAMSQLALADFDARSVAAALAAAVVTGLVFGCTAALHAVRHSRHDALRTVAPSSGAGGRTHRLRSFLV
ncbi:MAG: ABC transporter permease, partial [Solirubrobacteraceae bacterium]